MQTYVVSDNEQLSAKVRKVLLWAGHDCPDSHVVSLARGATIVAPSELTILVMSPDPERAIATLESRDEPFELDERGLEIEVVHRLRSPPRSLNPPAQAEVATVARRIDHELVPHRPGETAVARGISLPRRSPTRRSRSTPANAHRPDVPTRGGTA